MPFVLIIIGIGLMAIGVRDTGDNFFALLKGDFSGPNNFIRWVMAIALLVGAGYIKPIRPIVTAFLVLVIIGMILSNKGLIAKLQSINLTAPIQSNSNIPAIPAIPAIGEKS